MFPPWAEAKPLKRLGSVSEEVVTPTFTPTTCLMWVMRGAWWGLARPPPAFGGRYSPYRDSSMLSRHSAG